MKNITVTPNSADSIAQDMYRIFYSGYKEIHGRKDLEGRLKTNWLYKVPEERKIILDAVEARFEEVFPYSNVQIEVEYFDTPGDERENLNKFYVSYE